MKQGITAGLCTRSPVPLRVNGMHMQERCRCVQALLMCIQAQHATGRPYQEQHVAVRTQAARRRRNTG